MSCIVSHVENLVLENRNRTQKLSSVNSENRQNVKPCNSFTWDNCNPCLCYTGKLPMTMFKSLLFFKLNCNCFKRWHILWMTNCMQKLIFFLNKIDQCTTMWLCWPLILKRWCHFFKTWPLNGPLPQTSGLLWIVNTVKTLNHLQYYMFMFPCLLSQNRRDY